MVSAYASGIMLDYIRNKDKALRYYYLYSESKQQENKELNEKSKKDKMDKYERQEKPEKQEAKSYDVEIRRGLRRCFKYTQERLKVIYKAY